MVRVSPRSTYPTCASASIAPIRRAPTTPIRRKGIAPWEAGPPAADWGWRSAAGSPPPTTGASPSARYPGAELPSISGYRWKMYALLEPIGRDVAAVVLHEQAPVRDDRALPMDVADGAAGRGARA